MSTKKSKDDKPKVPQRNCRRAAAWGYYYAAMSEWWGDIARHLQDTYPTVADYARREASRFQDGAIEIKNRTHPSVVSGKWR